MCHVQTSPPVARDVPPVAGAIQWSRGLMARCQRTMNAIEALQPSLLQSPFGATVSGAIPFVGPSVDECPGCL